MVATHYAAALRAYQPRPYPGRITLFRAKVQPLLRWEELEMGWSSLPAGGIELHIVEGNHGSVVLEPHVCHLAKALGTALSRASACKDPQLHQPADAPRFWLTPRGETGLGASDLYTARGKD